MGYNQAIIVQEYQSLVSVVSQALGGPAPNKEPEGVRPQSEAQMKAAFAAVFGNG